MTPSVHAPSGVHTQYNDDFAELTSSCGMLQALKSGQWSLSDSEVSQLLAQLEVTPQGEFDYADW
jgi:hypothetical protein